MISNVEYNLGKYLEKCIKRDIPSNFMLDSTCSFLDRIRNFVSIIRLFKRRINTSSRTDIKANVDDIIEGEAAKAISCCR